MNSVLVECLLVEANRAEVDIGMRTINGCERKLDRFPVGRTKSACFTTILTIDIYHSFRSQIPEEDPNNRFSIGESFLKPKQSQNDAADAKNPSQSLIQSELIAVPDSVLNLTPPPPPLDDGDAAAPGNLYLSRASDSIVLPPTIPVIPRTTTESLAELSKYCEICDINVTSEMHMRLHLNGAKHAKKLRQLGEPPHTEAPDMLAQCIISPAKFKRKHSSAAATVAAVATTVTTTTLIESTATSDFSVFRTPSGQYYCQICDLSVTSEVTLSQHFSSKRHIRVASQSKRK